VAQDSYALGKVFCQLDPIRSGSVVFFLDKVPLEPFAQLMIKLNAHSGLHPVRLTAS
jgi:hypothetical protein